ncbi:sugar ABC transporter substrate-binding protein [Candidatus Bipolaricaulota bacterium]|nr:sugar ABC transporter substrate-binding protein [Candidatus Bipolaricaulota bacterium]
MKRLLRTGTLVCTALLVIFGTFATYAVSADDVTVGVVINTLRHPYYVQLVDSYRTAAAELGIDIIIKDPDADSNRQVSMIQELISVQQVDALCVDPCVPGTLAGVIQEATDLGIPVITGAGHAAGETCFVGSDNYVGGRMAGVFAGQWLQENVVGRSPVIAIAESTRYPIPNLRIAGFLEGINEFVSDAIVVIRDTDATKLDAMSKVEDILSQYDRVDCTFGINDAASLGALAACESKFGATNMVSCGFDCDPDGIATLQSPEHPAFMADVAQYTYLIARISLVQAVKAAQGEEVPARIWAPCQLATRENVEEVLSTPPAMDDSYINL